MPSQALNVNGYIDRVIQKQLNAQATATKNSVSATNISPEEVNKAFGNVYTCLNRLIHNDQNQLRNTRLRAKQIQDSINQLSGIKAIFSPSCRAMRSALKDSLNAEEYMIDTYHQHLSYLKHVIDGIRNLVNNLKSNNKICLQRVHKAYTSVKHISNDLHN